ncbi:MAG: alpha/beta hydrolase [Dehalococcoidia bacterium]
MGVLTEDFFDSDGVRLHYIDWGGSGPPLVLLGGLGGTARLYGGLAPRLGERFRVASFTRRGHGRSDRPGSGYDIDTLVEDIRRFFDFLGIERAALAGHSWAGQEIPLFATKYPERVDAVIYFDAVYVLLEPQLDPAADPALAALETEPRREDLVSREAYLGFIKRSRPDLASIWCDAVEADRIENIRAFVRHGPATSIVAQMEAGLGPHRDPAYADVKAPALALVPGGTTHPFVPPDAPEELRRAANAYYAANFVPRIQRRTERFRRAVPTARIIELDTSNHTLFVAKEHETVEAIFEFLGS